MRSRSKPWISPVSPRDAARLAAVFSAFLGVGIFGLLLYPIADSSGRHDGFISLLVISAFPFQATLFSFCVIGMMHWAQDGKWWHFFDWEHVIRGVLSGFAFGFIMLFLFWTVIFAPLLAGSAASMPFESLVPVKRRSGLRKHSAVGALLMVGSLPITLGVTLPFVSHGGVWILYIGSWLGTALALSLFQVVLADAIASYRSGQPTMVISLWRLIFRPFRRGTSVERPEP